MHHGWVAPFKNMFMFLTGMPLVFFFLHPWIWRINRDSLPGEIIAITAIYVQAVCLCILLMIRSVVIATQVIDNPTAALSKPFDFLAMAKGSRKTCFYGLVSEYSLRCVSFVLWTFARLTACAAGTGIGFSYFSDAA
jgi:hypothetical protein